MQFMGGLILAFVFLLIGYLAIKYGGGDPEQPRPRWWDTRRWNRQERKYNAFFPKEEE